MEKSHYVHHITLIMKQVRLGNIIRIRKILPDLKV